MERGGREEVFTRNLVPGNRTYGEALVRIEGTEYRAWDPFRSKLAAAILKGLPPDAIGQGDRVLYLGTSTGTTPSHVSDIVGPAGLLVGVESAPRVGREFVESVARVRSNVVPYIADARDAERFSSFGRVDVVYCDVAQQDQSVLAIKHCRTNLKKGGRLLLVVKSRSIDVLKDPRDVFRQERDKLLATGFRVDTTIELSPFDKDHALISAVFDG
ncbi:MAG: fibrillarin-like rRNA/tRNA 2'-O-methyltransferase [Nitrososphaerales archaeon]